jgi:hypothetical protein
MSRLPSFLIAAGAVTATVLLVTVDNPYLQPAPAPELEAVIPGSIPPEPVGTISEATPPALPPPPPTESWFALETGKGMTFILRGVLPTPEASQAVVDSVTRGTPELFVVKDEIRIDTSAETPRWIGDFAALAGGMVGSVQDPSLRLGPDTAMIEGRSDREPDLASLRTRFQSLAADYEHREDRLRLDPSRPARETRMPLVLYLAVVEGVYHFEGSLPSHGLVRATSEAASASAGEDRFSGNLRVSGRTVDEPWITSLPALVAALLEGKRDGMELIVVDRAVTLKGEVPDEPTKEKLLELAKPAREAGYAVKDELTVKK